MAAPEGYRDSWSASTEDVKRMSDCIKWGYLIYPKVLVYCKYWPNVVLAYTYRGKEYVSKNEFAQKYLSFAIHALYNAIHAREKTRVPPPPKVQNSSYLFNPDVSKRAPLPPTKLQGPSPPPKTMAPPPPPKS
jgi:hypothetical protein